MTQMFFFSLVSLFEGTAISISIISEGPTCALIKYLTRKNNSNSKALLK